MEYGEQRWVGANATEINSLISKFLIVDMLLTWVPS
jgi:hypothetical protein